MADTLFSCEYWEKGEFWVLYIKEEADYFVDLRIVGYEQERRPA